MRSFLFLFVLLGFNLLASNVWAEECPRIISQSPYITHTLQYLGVEKCIVGVSRYDTLDLPHTGGILDPDTQAIDSLFADIIFTTNWITEEAIAKATPEGVRYIRLNGFYAMNEIEHNMRVIGRVAGLNDYDKKIWQYKKKLADFKKKINGKGKKALLISSCSGSPYSFGEQSWLFDLFQQLNFKMVETHQRIRHIKPGQEITELTHLLNTYQPDIMFIFERELNSRCKLILPKVPVKIISLDGKHFLHPAPILLKGLEELSTKQKLWQ